MSEQKNSDRLEEKLRDCEQRNRALFERTNDAVFLFSLEDIHMEVNQQAADMLGYSVEEIVGQPISKFTKPGEEGESQKIKKMLLAGKKIPIYERTFIKKDGTEFPAEINIAVVKDSFGNVTHYQSIVRDITDRKKAEESLLLTQTTLDNLADAVYWVGPDAKFIYVNNAAVKALGFSRDELLSMTVHDIGPDFPAEVWAEHWVELKEKKSLFLHTVHQRKNGFTFPVEVTANFIQFGDKEINCAIAKDVTDKNKAEIELHESKNRMQAILDASPDIIHLLDSNGIILSSNEGFATRMGIELDKAIGKSVFDYGLPESQPERKAAIKKVFRTGEMLEFETKGIDSIFESYAHPVFNPEGKVTAVAVYARDITERKRAEKSLKESEVQLKNIFENSTSLFYSHTPDHIITYLSPQVKDILGYTQKEAMIKWTELVSDNPINEAGFKHTIRAIETCKRQPPYELELVKKGGNKIQVEVREIPLVEKGKTTAIIGSLVDITERKKGEEEILKLKDGLELQVAEKTKELNEKVEYLERFYNATVERELRMKELSDENEKLKAELEKKG